VRDAIRVSADRVTSTALPDRGRLGQPAEVSRQVEEMQRDVWKGGFAPSFSLTSSLPGKAGVPDSSATVTETTLGEDNDETTTTSEIRGSGSLGGGRAVSVAGGFDGTSVALAGKLAESRGPPPQLYTLPLPL